jgi:hypothetical protein
MNCGCLSFHLTIGKEAFILSTLATPVLGHDITKEFSQFSRVLSLFQFLFGSCSLQLRALSLGYGLGEVSQMIPRHQAHGLQFGTHWRALCISLVRFPHSLFLSPPSPLCVLPWEACQSYHVPSIRRKLRSAGPCHTSG